MQSRSGLSRALQWHRWVVQVHGRSQFGTVFSGELLLNVPAFMSM